MIFMKFDEKSDLPTISNRVHILDEWIQISGISSVYRCYVSGPGRKDKPSGIRASFKSVRESARVGGIGGWDRTRWGRNWLPVSSLSERNIGCCWLLLAGWLAEQVLAAPSFHVRPPHNLVCVDEIHTRFPNKLLGNRENPWFFIDFPCKSDWK